MFNFFPRRGHSLMLLDIALVRVLRKHYEILNNYGMVNSWGKEWKNFGYKAIAQQLLKKKTTI